MSPSDEDDDKEGEARPLRRSSAKSTDDIAGRSCARLFRLCAQDNISNPMSIFVISNFKFQISNFRTPKVTATADHRSADVTIAAGPTAFARACFIQKFKFKSGLAFVLCA